MLYKRVLCSSRCCVQIFNCTTVQLYTKGSECLMNVYRKLTEELKKLKTPSPHPCRVGCSKWTLQTSPKSPERTKQYSIGHKPYVTRILYRIQAPRVRHKFIFIIGYNEINYVALSALYMSRIQYSSAHALPSNSVAPSALILNILPTGGESPQL